MNRQLELFAGMLAVLIVVGGVAVAFLNQPASQQSSGAVEAANGTILMPSNAPSFNTLHSLASSLQGNVAGFNAAVASTTTATMTVTSAAIGYGSPLPPGSSSTVVVQNGPNNPANTPSQAQGAQQAISSGRSVEFFSNVTLRVPSTSLVLDKVSGVAYSFGGYVAYSFFTNSTALVVVRVPAENYQHALDEIETLGTVVGAVTSSNDVTVKYTDLNATLVSLKSEEASLLRLLNESSNVNATLRIYSMVQQVNEQINEVQSEILQTKTLIDYATISVSLEKQSIIPPPKPLSLKFTATPKSGFSPLSVTFNAIVSGGTLPYIVNYNFGDGTSARAQALIHSFDQPDRYNVTVTATDATGNVTEAWTLVDALNPPLASSFGNFPAFVGGLFLSVIEGIIEVAVVVLPIAAVIGLIVIPVRRRLASKNRTGTTAAPSTPAG